MASSCDFFPLYFFFLSCFCLFSNFYTAQLPANQTDRLALLSFKMQITSDPFNSMASWNDSNHFCDWEGITCYEEYQRVSELNLTSQGLVGQIPPIIGALHLLQVIDLSDNNLVGKLPVELGELSDLYYVDVWGNMLHGSIPPALGNLTSLETIDLSNNRFDGSIPHTLRQLKNLTFLSLGQNNLSGMFPPSLYNLFNLEIFSVVDNHLHGTLPVNIGSMLPKITEIYLGNNQFYGPLPASLFNASNLQVIDIPNNQFTGGISPSVGNLRDLYWLNLAFNSFGSGKAGDLDFIHPLTKCSHLHTFWMHTNNFGGTLPTSAANFSKSLQRLDLSSNKISGNIPFGIENLQNLYSIDMSHNLITGTIPRNLGNLHKLQALGLQSNQLSGNVPSSIRDMSSLVTLSLSNNFLEGSISEVLKIQNLANLNLSHNKFWGTIPSEISKSLQLLQLDLSNNKLNGSIPSEMGNLVHLSFFAISNNNVSGEIPKTLGECSSLQFLYLNNNSLEGPLPHTLENLKDLQVLSLSHNHLTGNILRELVNLTALNSLDMSFNHFEGEVPKEGIFQNKSAFSVTGNRNICGGILKLNLPKCAFQQSPKHGTNLPMKVILGVLIPLMMMALLLFIYLREKARKNSSEESPFDFWRVSYNDIHKATSGFSSTNLIGTGCYAFVYKGVLRQGENIAVKVLKLQESGASKNFVAECEALRVARHRNLLKIHTVCSSVDFAGNDFKALVSQFMANGNLDSWLHQSSDRNDVLRSLNFPQRLNIAIDVASGLDYLHNYAGVPIVHCDLKPSTVLLDEGLTAHVSDFGLAKFLPMTTSTFITTMNNTESSSVSIRGTVGYIPPEYGVGGKVSTQGDVYSFGILLLEMFTGKRPTDDIFKDERNLHDFCRKMLPQQVTEIIDMSMLSNIHDESPDSANQLLECFGLIVKIGVACSMDVMSERMSIRDALKELHSIKRKFVSGTGA